MFAHRRRAIGGRDPYAMLLLLQLAQQIYQIENKPPVTVAAIGFQVALHFGLLPTLVPHFVEEVCLQPASILSAGLLSPSALRRLVGSAFLHVNDYHLAYNMGSLLWKGVQLERMHSPTGFGVMLAALIVLSGLCTVALATGAAVLGYHDWAHECSVGFSGVLFALKTILFHDSPGSTSFYGLSIPSRYAAWAELLFLYVFMPSTSFVGHLGGILAGLLYLTLHTQSVTRRVTAACRRAWAGLVAALTAPPEAYTNDAFNGTGRRPGQRFYGGGVPLGTAASGAGSYASGASNDGLRHRPRPSAPPAEGAESDADLARRLQREEDERARHY